MHKKPKSLFVAHTHREGINEGMKTRRAGPLGFMSEVSYHMMTGKKRKKAQPKSEDLSPGCSISDSSETAPKRQGEARTYRVLCNKDQVVRTSK